MRVISPQLEAHFASGMTTLATCWLITRGDGTELGFTDHDQSLTIDSVDYDSIAGFTPTTVESKSNMSVDNLDVEGQVFPSKITEEDLLAGLYDYAEIEIFVVNYADLTQGKLVVKRGRLGEVTLSSQMFQAKVRGLTQHLSQTIGEVFSPSCRAILGDSRCKVALASFTVSATVTEVTNNQTFKASTLAQVAGWFTGGEVEWTGGSNDGRPMEVKEFASTQVVLALPMGKSIQVVYGTNVQSKQDGYFDYGGAFTPSGSKKYINMHNYDGKADVLVAVDQLLKVLPNLEWVAVVVTWFATSTDAGACEIIPKVEFQGTTQVLPQDWAVAGYTRSTAQKVLFFDEDTPTYGGTPSDHTVVQLVAHLKSKGLKVMLYPMPFVDRHPNK